MSAGQLNLNTTAMATPEEMTEGVLAVLGGSSLDLVAADLGIQAADLVDAIQTYQRAGRTALETQAADRAWYQVHIGFPEWNTAEKTVATAIDPQFQLLQDTGVITAWWFIRKAPCWRLRMKPGRTIDHAAMRASINSILDETTAAGLISRWRQTCYEPEAAAFGSQAGIDIAHDLFAADSSHILDYLRQPEPIIGRRELSVLLCGTLFHAAGQEWFECGDIWHRVARLRPIPANTPTGRLAELTENIRKLLTYDARPTGALFGADGLLSFAGPWAAAFNHAGQALAAAANEGTLKRGTRDILAHHVIFHWNRIGLSATTQSILANVAKTVVLGQ